MAKFWKESCRFRGMANSMSVGISRLSRVTGWRGGKVELTLIETGEVAQVRTCDRGTRGTELLTMMPLTFVRQAVLIQ
jgi:hypothetical protein